MRIAIDAHELSGQVTGVGRYLLQVLRAWSHLPEAVQHEFILCSSAPLNIDLPANAQVITSAGSGTRWMQLTLPWLIRRAHADVLFAPAYEAPLLSRIPTVLSVHDVSFLAHPEWFAPRERVRRRVVTRLSARRASKILTFSEFSKLEIVRYLNVPAERVEVTYHGITTLGNDSNDPNARNDPNVKNDPNHPNDWHDPNVPNDPNDPNDALVLFVGSIFNRRHVPELIEGFSRLAERHPAARLEIVGDNRSRPFQDLAAIASRWPWARTRARSYVSDSQLAALYRRARAFVFLSDYEGFGMTPIEALAAGVPIVVLDTPVSREIYGTAALYLQRPDPALIATGLERLVYDEQERTRLLADAEQVLRRYSWRACAQRTLQALVHARS